MNRLFSLLTLAALSYTTAASDCIGTTADMMVCADKDYQIADKRLNQTYNALKKTLDVEGTKLLLDSQRAWLKFRDTNCSLAADQTRGGTMAGLLQIGCLSSMTDLRTKELNELINGLGR